MRYGKSLGAPHKDVRVDAWGLVPPHHRDQPQVPQLQECGLLLKPRQLVRVEVQQHTAVEADFFVVMGKVVEHSCVFGIGEVFADERGGCQEGVVGGWEDGATPVEGGRAVWGALTVEEPDVGAVLDLRPNGFTCMCACGCLGMCMVGVHACKQV